MIRILVADDHEGVRREVCRMLGGQPGWIVCGEAANGREALAMTHQLRPDVAVIDFAMPELNGLEVARQIRAALPQTEVLILTVFDSEHLIREALAAGARGFVSKHEADSKLLAAVEQLSRHQTYVPVRVSKWTRAEGVSQAEKPSAGDLLSLQERAVLQLIAEGRGPNAIAAALHIDVEAVEQHCADLMDKLKVGSMSELVHHALRYPAVAP